MYIYVFIHVWISMYKRDGYSISMPCCKRTPNNLPNKTELGKFKDPPSNLCARKRDILSPDHPGMTMFMSRLMMMGLEN